jgi:uncharacterized membrane protein
MFNIVNVAYSNAEIGLDGRMMLAVVIYSIIGILLLALGLKIMTNLLKLDVKKELAKDQVSSTALVYSAIIIALGVIIASAN